MRYLAACLCLLLAMDPAHATIRQMGWDDSVNFSYDHAPDCGALPDESVLVVGFVPTITDVSGMYAYIDVCTRPYDLPGWWNFNDPGSCRPESLRVSLDFSGGPFLATVPWSDQATISHNVIFPYYGDERMTRIEVFIDDPGLGAGPLTPGEPYYAFRMIFGNPDVGCEGCDIPACFVLNGLVLSHSGGLDYSDMTYENWMMWQGGTDNCPFVVQTDGTTWGRLKALYR